MEGLKPPAILTVSGALPARMNTNLLRFDREMLASRGWHEFQTITSLDTKERRLSGVTLGAFLSSLGIDGGTLRAVSAQDDVLEIAFSDALQQSALLALDLNGRPLGVQEMGPIWLVFPVTKEEAAERNFVNRTVVQLVRIEIAR